MSPTTIRQIKLSTNRSVNSCCVSGPWAVHVTGAVWRRPRDRRHRSRGWKGAVHTNGAVLTTWAICGRSHNNGAAHVTQ